MCGVKLLSTTCIVLEVCRSFYYGGAMCWDAGITFIYLSNEDLSFCSSLIKVLKVLWMNLKF